MDVTCTGSDKSSPPPSIREKKARSGRKTDSPSPEKRLTQPINFISRREIYISRTKIHISAAEMYIPATEMKFIG